MAGVKSAHQTLRTAGIMFLVALAYYITGRLGLMLAGPTGYASVFWPPAGIALAVILAYGYKIWPSIFIAAFAINIFPSFDSTSFAALLHSCGIGLGIATGATLQALGGAWLARRFVKFPNPLEEIKDIGMVVLCGGPVACVISATLGVTLLATSHVIAWDKFDTSWLMWWVGDSTGVIVLTPILLLVLTPHLAVSVSRKIIVSLILCMTFSISVYAFFAAIDAEQQKRETDFNQYGSYLHQQLDQKLHSYSYILFSIDRFFASSDVVSEEEFHSFVTKLFKEYPGLNAVTWRKRVPYQEREEYEQVMRNKGHKNFTIHERNLETGERTPAPVRDVYYPTTYVEFPDNREKTIGSDSYNDKARREALDKARDSGQTVMSDQTVVFKNEKRYDAASLYHPVYDHDMENATTDERREHIQGFISSSFVFSEMLQDIKRYADSMGLIIRLIDNETDKGKSILYSSENGVPLLSDQGTGPLLFERSISLGGQNWTLQAVPTVDYIGHSQGWAVWLVLASGLLFTGLFGIFLLIVTGRTDVVERLVDEKTKALSAQERALEAINRLNNAVLSSASYLIIATDSEGKIIVFNREAENALGYSADEVMYRHTPALWHDREELIKRASELSSELRSQVTPGMDVFTIKALLHGQEKSEWSYIRKDGTKFPGELVVTPMYDNDGQVVGFLSIVLDVTERRKIEKMKSEFISTVSHELRTPLTSIRGSLGLIASGALGQLPEKMNSMVRIAHNNSERLVRIINDILDIEKIESGNMEMKIQAVNIREFLQQAAESNAAYGEKYNVKFVLESAPACMVLADPDRLMQVMANLLSNAAKFSSPGSSVLIRTRISNNKVRVEVQDTGAGIAPEFRNRIFSKFAQADSSNTRRFDGTGLGLSITKKFVEAMKGQIGFETEMGKGTTFYFDLPQVQQGRSRKDEVINRILICEHEMEVAEFIKVTLEHAGFETDIASSIQEARQKLNNSVYAAITLDLVMPDINGADFLRELRSNPETFSLPVVVISVAADKTKRIMLGDALGVIDWLTKPIDQLKLINTVRHSIAHNNQSMPNILHVEDDDDLTQILSEALRGRARFISAPTLKDAYRELHSQRPDLVIIDLAMPDGSGLELLEHIHQTLDYTVPLLILSASETTQDVQAKVAKALVKSRMSEEKIVETILSLIQPAEAMKKERA